MNRIKHWLGVKRFLAILWIVDHLPREIAYWAYMRVAFEGASEPPLSSRDPAKQTIDEPMTRWRERTRLAVHHSRGQTLVEYGLLLALIAVIVIAALLFLGPVVSNLFTNIGNVINDT